MNKIVTLVLGLLVSGNIYAAQCSRGMSSGGFFSKAEYYCDTRTNQMCFAGDFTGDRDICVDYNENLYGTKTKRKAALAKFKKRDTSQLNLSEVQKNYIAGLKQAEALETEVQKARQQMEREHAALAKEARKLGLEVTGQGLDMVVSGDLSAAELTRISSKAEDIRNQFNAKMERLNLQHLRVNAKHKRLVADVKAMEVEIVDDHIAELKKSKAEEAKIKEAQRKELQIKKMRQKVEDGDLQEVLDSTAYDLLSMDEILDTLEEVQDDAEMGIYMQAKLSRVESNFCGAVKSCNETGKADLKLDEVFQRKSKRNSSSRMNKLRKGTQ